MISEIEGIVVSSFLRKDFCSVQRSKWWIF